MKMRSNSGFTLVELLVAIALGLVLLAGLYRTFKVQHDSYIVQDQVAAMQQNLRAAVYMITRDLQMAGWYTNFDRNNRTIHLGDDDLGEITGRPLLFATNNYALGDDVMRDGTDALVIVKAAKGTQGTITAYIPEGTGDFSASLSGFDAGNTYGILVKNDLRTADFFKVGSPSLNENYDTSDMVFRADIIVYKIEDDASLRPMLTRRNLGNDNGYQRVAENIENLQVRYLYKDGTTWTDDPSVDPSGKNQQPQDVRAVEVLLVGRTAFPQRGYVDTKSITFGGTTIPAPNDHYRRKVLSTIVKTRNVGLSS